MQRERGEPAIADTSKPILEAPVVPDFPSNPDVPRPSVEEDPDVVAARTDHPSPYSDNEEIIDTGDDDSEIFNRNGIVVGDEELEDDDLTDDDKDDVE